VNVTACLVTRGDQPEMMERIRDSLIFDDVIVWDNSATDRKTAGRYYATLAARTDLVYYQDDDVIVPPETQQALVDAHEAGAMVATYAHGDNDGGYGDLPLVCGGGIVDRDLPWQVLNRYLDRHPLDPSFLYYCDFAAGVLYPKFKQLDLPFHIELPVAQHPSRLCNQPWAADMKAEVTRRAREIRDA
jgi:glycosyl transferase family 2